MTQVAIIGVGRWGKILIREFNNVSKVKACLHKGAGENEKWIKENYPHIKIYDSLENLLSNKDIKIIVIASPIQSHFELAKLALLAGKHVFIEKPPSTNVSDYELLLDLAKKRKTVLFTNNTYLYHPLYSKFIKLVKNNNIRKAEFKWFKFGTFSEDIFWNLAYHEIYLALSFFGELESVGLTKEAQSKTNTDAIQFNIKFAHGTSSEFIINRRSNQKYKSIEIISDTKIYQWLNDTIFVKNKSADYQLLHQSSEKPLKSSIKEFISRVNGETSNTMEESLIINSIRTIQTLKGTSK